MNKLFHYLLFGCLIAGSVSAQDLRIQNYTLTKSAYTSGQNVNAFVKVINEGKNLAGQSQVGFYLSQDKKLTMSDSYLAGSSLNQIYPSGADSLWAYFSLPSNLTDGTYYLFAFADNAGAVFETNEKNNSEFLEITVVQPTVDLSVPSFSAGKNEFAAGSLVTTQVTEQNTGNADASSHYIGYYLSTDAVLGHEDKLLTYEYTYGTLADSSSGYSPSFYLPSDLSNGEYYLLVHTDFENHVAETNESNNTAAVKIQVIDPVTDLKSLATVVNAGDSSYKNIEAGNTLYVGADILNNGTSAVYGINVGFYLSEDSTFGPGDTYLNSGYIYYLNNGQRISNYQYVSIPTSTPQGTYYVLSVTDYNNSISEADEENNWSALQINVVAPSIDLSLWNLTVNPSNISPGGYSYLSGYEFNEGKSYAPYHSVGFYLSSDSVFSNDDMYLTGKSIYGTYPGSYNNLDGYFVLPDSVKTGKYYIVAVSDPENQVAELNENNNTASTPVYVAAPFIDHTLSLYRYDTSAVASGSYVYLQATDQNSGNTYSGDHYISFYLSSDSTFDVGDTQLSSYPVYGLSGNGSYTYYPSLQLPAGAQPGTWYIVGVTDYPSYLAESNEENNTAVVRIDVEASETDLSIAFNSGDSLVVNTGTWIYPALIESNTGSTYAPIHYISYYLSNDAVLDTFDLLLNSQEISGLSGNSSNFFNAAIYIPDNVSPGSYYLIAKADNYNTVNETNEYNNTAYLKTYINPSSVDLAVTSFYPYNYTVNPGEYVSASITETNFGNTYSSAYYTAYFLSTDENYSADDYFLNTDYVYGLGAGESSYRNPYFYIPSYYAAGKYYIIAVTDTYNQVQETEEKNNIVSTAINIGANGTDLKITSVSTNNTNPYPGNLISINVTEYNAGNVGAGNHHVAYFLSTDAYYNTGDTYLTTNFISDLGGFSSIELNPSVYLPSSLAYGNYYLIAVADYGYNVSETDEYNNTAAVQITVGTIPSTDPDLAPGVFTYANAVYAGKYLPISWSEQNYGSKGVTGHDVSFYLSTDNYYSYDDLNLGHAGVNGLEAYGYLKDSADLYVPYSVYSGYYYILAVSDAGNIIYESDESNNVAYYPIEVVGVVTGTESESSAALKTGIYPNPGNGVINFTTLENADEIEVSDLNSQNLLTINVKDLNSKSMDLSHLGEGMYLVRTSKNGVVTSTNKLVINK